MIFEMHKQHLIEDDKELDKIYKDCKAGTLTCGECKDIACDKMADFMDSFNKKVAEAKNNMDKLNFVKFS